MFKLSNYKGDTGFYKFKIFHITFIGFDSYILIYPKGAYLMPHKDTVKNHTHVRLNILFWRARKGGDLLLWDQGRKVRSKKRVKILKADRELHGISKVEKGVRITLSFGLLKSIRQK